MALMRTWLAGLFFEGVVMSGYAAVQGSVMGSETQCKSQQ